jgi:hypothetical protein
MKRDEDEHDWPTASRKADSIQTNWIAIQIPILIGQNHPGKCLPANSIALSSR